MKKLLLSCLLGIGIAVSGQTTVTIGTGTGISSTGTNASPIYRSGATSSFDYSQSVELLTSTDLAAAGIPSGATISKIAYYKGNAETLSAGRTATVNLYMKNSSLAALNGTTNFATWTAGATTVYNNTTFGSVPTDLPAAAGWVEFNLSTPFQYTGGGIETAINWAINTGTGNPTTGGFNWQYTTVSSVQAVGNSSSSPITANLISTATRLYNVQITYTVNACTGTPAPGNTLSSTTPVCAGSYNTTLSVQNATSGTGVTYQWYKNGTAIAGATSSVYSTTITAADTYYLAVTCGGTTTNSTPLTVTAPLANIVPAYTNSFNPYPGNCWQYGSGNVPPQGPSGTTQYWFDDGFLNNGSTGAAKMNIYFSNRLGWLITPSFDLSAGGYRVKFDYGATEYADTTPIPAMGSDDVMQFVMSTDNGATWTVLQTWNAANTPSNSTNSYIYILPASASVNNVKFAFYGSSGTVADTEDYEFFIDNFAVEPVPACTEPSNVTFNTITVNSAVVNWTAPSPVPAGGYDIYYSTSNVAPTATSTPNQTGVTTTTAAISALQPATIYYVWVRSRCSGTQQSIWVSGGSFTTFCNPTNVPYSQNFDSATTPALPMCTTVINAGGGNAWITATAPTGYTGNVLQYSFNGSNAADTWLFTQGLNLTAGTTYYISYRYGNNSTNFVEKLKVAVGTGPNAAAMTTVLNDHSQIDDDTPHDVLNVPFTPATTGVYYVGFQAYSNADQFYLYVDEINVTSTLLATDEAAASDKGVQIYPNPFTETLNIDKFELVKSVTIIDASGRMVKRIAKPQSEINTSDLNSGMYLVKLEMKDGSVKTVKAIRK